VWHTAHAAIISRRGELLMPGRPSSSASKGRFARTAVAVGAIDADGRLGGRHKPGVERVAKELRLRDAFERFLVRRVYGGTGHLFRHGAAADGVEHQVVYMAVAVAGWLDVIGHAGPWTWLAAGLEASEGLADLVAAHADEADDFFLDLMAKSFEGKSPHELDALRELLEDWPE
jgi:hypothetical protein